jgi:hypothetical protein
MAWTTQDFYEKYFGNCSVKEQANLIESKEHLRDYLEEVHERQYGDEEIEESDFDNLTEMFWDSFAEYRDQQSDAE